MHSLASFLIRAKTNTYAAGEKAQKIIEQDQSTTLVFEEGDWKYHDNYFGGEPYGGREVVFFQGKPVWMMLYYGWVDPSVSDPHDIYQVLRGALSQIPADAPYRGQTEYREGSSLYQNSFTGILDQFSGTEVIFFENQEVYRAHYMGGKINQ